MEHKVTQFFLSNWGNLASVVGLLVSIATLVVATKARKAALAARAEARRRSLAEELQDAAGRAEQVGQYILSNKWDIVWLRSQEIASACSLVLTRWDTDLSEKSKDNILRAQRLSGSLAEVATEASRTAVSKQEILRMSATQGRISQLLNAGLGESLRSVERSE